MSKDSCVTCCDNTSIYPHPAALCWDMRLLLIYLVSGNNIPHKCSTPVLSNIFVWNEGYHCKLSLYLLNPQRPDSNTSQKRKVVMTFSYVDI